MKDLRRTQMFEFLVVLTLIGLPADASEPPKLSSKEVVELRAKAEAGDAKAQYNIGVSYAFGQGAPKDESEAVKWFRKAAEQGEPLSQYNLGVMYSNGGGVQKNETEAVKWFRKAAEQGYAMAQYNLGSMCSKGRGVPKDETEAVMWYRKSAEQDDVMAQFNLGVMYNDGRGVPKDEAEAVKWYLKAAQQGYASAQYNLALMYQKGQKVPKDEAEAVKWYRKAALQGLAQAQFGMGLAYAEGQGVPKDEMAAYMWWLLARAQGIDGTKKNISLIERHLTPDQRAEGQRLAREFQLKKSAPTKGINGDNEIAQTQPNSTGTGFFITDDGHLITNQHVADEGATVRMLTAAGAITAKVVKVDKANDLALLKAEGKFAALPVTLSRSVRLGSTAATVGFPNVGLQGFSPKLARGEIASLAGAQDDARHFQISVPIQPGNSGGALVDERGNVIGVIVAKLSQKAALATTGTLAENVNYAVKSSYLLSFLESVPEVAAKLKEPITADRKFEDVIKDVEQAAVLVLVY